MKPGLLQQLAEKMAAEITLSDAPGKALNNWRSSFKIAPGLLADPLGISHSFIFDYDICR